jgi:hypothetical protein
MNETKLEVLIEHYDPKEAALNFDFADPKDITGSERRRNFVLNIKDGIDDFDERCLIVSKHPNFIRFEDSALQQRYMELIK